MPPAVIAATIAAGGALGGSLLSSRSNSNIANQQQQLAQQALARSGPAFAQANQYYQGILQGGPNLQASLAPSINAINSQYNSAMQNTLNSSYSRGGALDKALRTIQTGKAFSLSDLYGQAQTAAAGGLAGLAGSNQQAGAAALGAAQNSQIQNQTLNNQAFSGIGSLITRLITQPGIFGGNTSNPNVYQQPASTNSGQQYGPSIPQALIPDTSASYGGNNNSYTFAGLNG